MFLNILSTLKHYKGILFCLMYLLFFINIHYNYILVGPTSKRVLGIRINRYDNGMHRYDWLLQIAYF